MEDILPKEHLALALHMKKKNKDETKKRKLERRRRVVRVVKPVAKSLNEEEIFGDEMTITTITNVLSMVVSVQISPRQ